MTPKERAIKAFNLQQPDEVPTFELEFQLEEEMFGPVPITSVDFTKDKLKDLSKLEIEKKIFALCEYKAHVYKSLEYAIWPMIYLPDMWENDGSLSENQKLAIKYTLQLGEGKYMIHCHGDGTYSIPDGNQMYNFAYRLVDDFDGVLADAENMCKYAIEHNKRIVDAGVETLILCADYCYNMGPFVSPDTFSKIVTPYLARICEDGRKNGAFVIKHTDGDIMPIIDQLVACKPHALHSLDPMARVDIKKVKELYGDKVALCGNVNCALMQTGTNEEVLASAKYCLTYAKPNGGYFYCTSNVPFKGLPAERYQLVLDVWKNLRAY